MPESIDESKIGLALSGGGSRAIAFHLGCLRALHDVSLLERVEILSTVSGGSVIGALYAANEAPFPVFEKKVRAILSRGFVKPAIRKVVTTTEGVRALYCWLVLMLINGVFLALPDQRHRWQFDRSRAPLRRFASQTTILQRVLDDDIFHKMRFRDLPSAAPLLIVNATELRTGSAFYFSRNGSGSWRLGALADRDVTLAHAVAASAAYPLFLPALDENLPFDKKGGGRRVERVTLTDGGVYDNLGLAPLWPDRDPSISLNVSKLDSIICCRAGYGLRFDPPSQFFLARLKSTFATIHDRAQNAAMKRLFDLKNAGVLKNILLPYLGQDDRRLKYPPDDLVKRDDVYAYPTDFYAMPEEWIDKLSRRGGQLTHAVIAEHWPELLKAPSTLQMNK